MNTPRNSNAVTHEALARICVVGALTLLFFAVWMLNLPSAAGWSARAVRVLPRVSTFALGVLATLILQGGRSRMLAGSKGVQPLLSDRTLFGTALLAGACLLALQDWAGLFEVRKFNASMLGEMRDLATKTGAWAETDNNLWLHAPPGYFSSGVVLLLMRFACGLFAAVSLGTWVGRGAREGWHFLALILCAAVSDVWLNWFKIPDLYPGDNPLAILRLPFVPGFPGFCGTPALTDIFFAAAVLEAARVLSLHPASLALGAVAGYCSAAFLALEPAPGITLLSMTLMGSGIMAGAWPDLKLNSTGVAKSFLTMAVLILLTCSFVALQRALSPPYRMTPMPERLRNIA